MFNHQMELKCGLSIENAFVTIPFRIVKGDIFRHGNDLWICTSAYWDIKNCEQSVKAERHWD